MNQIKVLLIGGTGTISSSIMNQLSLDDRYEVTVMNRGHKPVPDNVKQIVCDVADEESFASALQGKKYDTVCDFIVYTASQAENRVEVLRGKCTQYIFISTVVTFDHENTVYLHADSKQNNPYSAYGSAKIRCEEIFRHAQDFPVTIVRPSQTYGYDRIPLSVKGKSYWGVIQRILDEKPVIIHGDGKSVWHMMHTQDFARNFVPLIQNMEVIGKAVNLVNPEMVTWDMIYQEIAAQLNKPLKAVHIASDTLGLSQKYANRETILGDKQYSNVYDTENTMQYVPDFACEINLKKGVEMYLSYMERHPDRKITDEAFDQWCDEVIASYTAYMKAFGENF